MGSEMDPTPDLQMSDDGDADENGRPLLDAFLGSWLAERDNGSTGSDLATVGVMVPFSIRLTLNHLYDLADETALRAHTLATMSSTLGLGNASPRKVRSLHRTAVELRHTAERLLREFWVAPTDHLRGELT